MSYIMTIRNIKEINKTGNKNPVAKFSLCFVNENNSKDQIEFPGFSIMRRNDNPDHFFVTGPYVFDIRDYNIVRELKEQRKAYPYQTQMGPSFQKDVIDTVMGGNNEEEETYIGGGLLEECYEDECPF